MGVAAASSQGDIIRGPAVFTADAARAQESLERIAALAPARMIFARGAELDAPADALARLIGSRP